MTDKPSAEALEFLRPYLFEGEYILQPDEAVAVLTAFAAQAVAASRQPSSFERGYSAAIIRLRGISPSKVINTDHEGQRWMRLCASYLEERKMQDIANNTASERAKLTWPAGNYLIQINGRNYTFPVPKITPGQIMLLGSGGDNYQLLQLIEGKPDLPIDVNRHPDFTLSLEKPLSFVAIPPCRE